MGKEFRVKHKNLKTAYKNANKAAASYSRAKHYTPAEKRKKEQKNGFWHVSAKAHHHCGSYDKDCIWVSREAERSCGWLIGGPDNRRERPGDRKSNEITAQMELEKNPETYTIATIEDFPEDIADSANV